MSLWKCSKCLKTTNRMWYFLLEDLLRLLGIIECIWLLVSEDLFDLIIMDFDGLRRL